MNISVEELTRRLIYLDMKIKELHMNGYYFVDDLADIEIINGEITMDSFKNKYDYLKSGFNINGDYNNILQLCAIGICAYNHLSVLHTSKEFINHVIENVEMYLEHGNIPSFMQEYYIDVFNRKKVDYLNNFLSSGNYLNNEEGRLNNSKALTKSTAAGRAFSEKDTAFVSVLLLPAMLALLYISVVVIYFVFFYNFIIT